MRTLRINLTTEDGELLDSATIEVSDEAKGITYRESKTTIPRSGFDEILLIPEKLP